MIFLAPLQGLTDFVFRNVYSRHYIGIDIAVSPFISLIQGEKGIPIVAKDVLPANNRKMPVVPQVLGNDPRQFIQMARILHDWGYKQLNWNLGCPVKNIIRKKRGSGLLPYPEFVREILDKVIPQISQGLSIKIRLGLKSTDEIYQLIPVLNDFPLENIIIHPRTAIQMYEGEIHHDVLLKCLPLFNHEIIYNGDISTLADYMKVKEKYPTIQKWMIGRGIFYNPLLPAIIKGIRLSTHKKKDEMFLTFLRDLYNELLIYLPEKPVLNRIKQMWKLFSKQFSESEIIFNKIAHTNTIEEVIILTAKIVSEEKMRK